MILKEKAAVAAGDWKQKAGDEAELEMAFYLRRYFADDPHVLVLHDVRLELDGDAAQMDHVLIHKAGLTVVESKSVAGKVQMQADGQWLRWYQDRSSGMASPLVQASLQCEFLRKYLRKVARQPEVIDALAIDYLVAISSRGVFLPPQGADGGRRVQGRTGRRACARAALGQSRAFSRAVPPGVGRLYVQDAHAAAAPARIPASQSHGG